MTILSDSEWQERYRITSLAGRIWTRSMVRKLAGDELRSLSLASPQRRRLALDEVLDDDAFMRPMAGSVPAHVAREVALRALARIARSS